MKITFNELDEGDCKRGETIFRGQKGSKFVLVNWLSGKDPASVVEGVTRTLIPIAKLMVEVSITRPDGQQSGWQLCLKKDGEVLYYYALQDWDTKFAGKGSVAIRWYNSDDSEGYASVDDNLLATIHSGGEYSIIIDNGGISHPVGVSDENYSNLAPLITALNARALKIYDVDIIESEPVDYSTEGYKAPNAIYKNFSHIVTGYNEGLAVKGSLLVLTTETNQCEYFFVGDKIFERTLDSTDPLNVPVVAFIDNHLITLTELVNNYYNKTEINTNHYTKTEINTNHYTKTEINTNHYTKTETNTFLNNKGTKLQISQGYIPYRNSTGTGEPTSSLKVSAVVAGEVDYSNTVPIRNANGQISVLDPTSDTHAVNKRYLIENFYSKLYINSKFDIDTILSSITYVLGQNILKSNLTIGVDDWEELTEPIGDYLYYANILFSDDENYIVGIARVQPYFYPQDKDNISCMPIAVDDLVLGGQCVQILCKELPISSITIPYIEIKIIPSVVV